MIPRYLSTILFLLVFVMQALLHAQPFDRDRRVGDGSSSAKKIAPEAEVAPDGTLHVVWSDFRDGGAKGQIYLSRSTDRGETFSAGRNVVPGAGPEAGMQRGPQLAIDRFGIMHLSWEEFNVNEKISARYARSTDGGLTFSTPLAVAADSGLHNQDFPSIAVDSSGNPFMAWIDTREQERGSSNNAQLYVVRSRDGGLTFEPPTRATYMPRGAGGTCECCNTSIAISRSGNVFVSFRSNITNDRDIYIARSLDGGITYRSIRAATETWRLNACPMTGSSIVVDRDETAHVVWRDSRPSSQGKDYIYYTSLRRSDTLCAPDRKISRPSSRSNYPSLGITPDGDLLCAFQDNRNDGADVYYTISTDGGQTFSPDAKVTHETGTSRQDLPSVAIAPDGTRYVVWQDTRLGAEQIMMTRSDAGVSAVIDGSRSTVAMGGFRPEPVQAGGRATFDLTLPVGGAVRVTVYDTRGTVAAVPFEGFVAEGTRQVSVDVSALVPGVYVGSVEYAGSRIARAFVVQ